MSAPAEWTWPVWVGNNDPFIFTLTDSLGVRVDLTGAVLVLRVAAASGAITMTSGVDAGLVIADQVSLVTRGQFTVRFSLAQTRLLTPGMGVRYEIEKREGADQTTILYGEITATLWENTDA